MLDPGREWSKEAGSDQFAWPLSPAPSGTAFVQASLWRHRRLLGLGLALFLILGLAYTAFRPTTYTASTHLLLYSRHLSKGPDPLVLQGRVDIPIVENQIELLRSKNVLRKVIEVLQLDRDLEFSNHRPSVRSKSAADEDNERFTATFNSVRSKLNARRVGSSHTVLVTFKASGSEKAAGILNKVTKIYLDELARAWNGGTATAPAIREVYQRLGPSAYIVSEAVPPIRPDGPPAVVLIVGAVLLGLIGIAGLAVLLDFLNNTVRSTAQLEHVLGLDCLGVIPHVNDRRKREDGDAVEDVVALPSATGFDLGSSGHPALSQLAAKLRHTTLSSKRRIGVTTTVPGEGATTIAIGLAQTLAASGTRVLLIDGVPEAPSISRWAGMVAKQDPRCSKAAGVIEALPNLDVLPNERLVLLDAYSVCPTHLDADIKELSNSYDVVIVDMPSLVSGPDVRASAEILDGFLLVAKWGSTDSELMVRAIDSAGDAQGQFIGAVLNMAGARATQWHRSEFVRKVMAWRWTMTSGAAVAGQTARPIRRMS